MNVHPSASSGRTVKAVLFDLDGTFADTALDLAAALNHTRAMRNLPPLPLAALRPQASHGSRGLLRTGFGIEPEHPDYDTLRDMQAANASGMRGIIANYGYVSADATVESWKAHGSINKPTELLGLIAL